MAHYVTDRAGPNKDQTTGATCRVQSQPQSVVSRRVMADQPSSDSPSPVGASQSGPAGSQSEQAPIHPVPSGFPAAAVRAAASMADDPDRVFSAVEHPERPLKARRRPDLLTQLPLAASWLAFGCAGLALMFLDNAQPRQYGLDRFFNFYRTHHAAGSIRVAFALTVLALILSLLGLLINSRRMRRASDRYNSGLLVCAGLSAVGVLWFVWQT